jgi:hypothetical protein
MRERVEVHKKVEKRLMIQVTYQPCMIVKVTT